jgi:hypothetical protein
MSTDTQQLNNQESSAQTPIILEAEQRVTAKLRDIQSFVEPVNALLKPERRLTNVVSLSEITRALLSANLNLKDEVIELNPKAGTTLSTIVELEDNSEYIGFNSITVRTKPLENRVVSLLTPALLNTEGGLTITKTSDDFCGMNQVEIQDIALASNIEYTIVPSDIEGTNDTIEFDFLTFDKFSDEIKEQYKDKVFGAKDLTVNVPLVEEHTFYVDATNIGKTYVPADIPEDFDGTGGKEAKIGFKRVGISAVLNSTCTKETISSAMTNTTSSGSMIELTGENNSLGFTAAEIPPVVSVGINLGNFIRDYPGSKINSSYISEIFKFDSSTPPDKNNLTYLSESDSPDAVGAYSLTLKYPSQVNVNFTNGDDTTTTTIKNKIYSIMSPSTSSSSFVFKVAEGILDFGNDDTITGTAIGNNLLSQLTIPLPYTFDISVDVDSDYLSTNFANNLTYINNLIKSNNIIQASSTMSQKPILSKFSTDEVPTSSFILNSSYDSFKFQVFNGGVYLNDAKSEDITNPFLSLELNFTELPPLKMVVVVVTSNNTYNGALASNNSSLTTDFPKYIATDAFYKGGVIEIGGANNPDCILFKSPSSNIKYDIGAKGSENRKNVTTNSSNLFFYESVDGGGFNIKMNPEVKSDEWSGNDTPIYFIVA